MKRKITFVLILSLFFSFSVLTQVYGIEGTEGFEDITHSIRNNDFFLESIRLTRLAQETFESGDYDASSGFAEEAIRYAMLSNEFIADQLIGEAGHRLDWANSNSIADTFPYEYNQGRNYYEASLLSQNIADWDGAILSATRAIEIFTLLESGDSFLPGQYTVRPWAIYRDCLWNIAGYAWVYGEPEKWPILYEANRSRMPDPGNPDLIEPGMVLEIPSISGETRLGMWDPDRSY